MSDPPIGQAAGCALLLLGLYLLGWFFVALWVALDPLSRIP